MAADPQLKETDLEAPSKRPRVDTVVSLTPRTFHIKALAEPQEIFVAAEGGELPFNADGHPDWSIWASFNTSCRRELTARQFSTNVCVTDSIVADLANFGIAAVPDSLLLSSKQQHLECLLVESNIVEGACPASGQVDYREETYYDHHATARICRFKITDKSAQRMLLETIAQKVHGWKAPEWIVDETASELFRLGFSRGSGDFVSTKASTLVLRNASHACQYKLLAFGQLGPRWEFRSQTSTLMWLHTDLTQTFEAGLLDFIRTTGRDAFPDGYDIGSATIDWQHMNMWRTFWAKKQLLFWSPTDGNRIPQEVFTDHRDSTFKRGLNRGFDKAAHELARDTNGFVTTSLSGNARSMVFYSAGSNKPIRHVPHAGVDRKPLDPEGNGPSYRSAEIRFHLLDIRF